MGGFTRRSKEGSGEVDPNFRVVVGVGQSVGFNVLSQKWHLK
jgi:hypothetical protein